MKRLALFLCWFVLAPVAGLWAQTSRGVLTGRIQDSSGAPIPYCRILLNGKETRTETNPEGLFRLEAPTGPATLQFVATGFKPRNYRLVIKSGENKPLNLDLEGAPIVSEDVTITDRQQGRDQVSFTTLDPKNAKVLPTPFGDFNKLLATLPGVVSNNELSSTYSVRGGSYDENLVYVNDMEIYRPFLVRSGQQEGLSFVNPDLVSNVEFSSGGWQPRFGDKLSSVLNVRYKTPTQWRGSLTAGILNQQGHVEGLSKDKKTSFVLGIRRKSAEYLFQNSLFGSGLDIQGEYLPRFVDIQTWITRDLTSKADSLAGRSLTLSFLGSFASNRYQVRPSERETDFGTITRKFRLFVAFEGQEIMNYNTYQSGVKLSRTFNSKMRSDVTVSGVATQEREKLNVEGGYRLSDVETDFSRDNFNQEIFQRGIGTYFNYGRNDLDAYLVNVLNRNYWQLDSANLFECGIGISHERIWDRLYEYNFIDSSDYVGITDFLQTSNSLNSTKYSLYAQNTWTANPRLTVTYGGRLNYWDLNGQLLFSPRVQGSYRPAWQRDWIFRLAAGVYQQPAFYREMRRFDGTVNRDLKAQGSFHLIGGGDYAFKIWSRPFRFTAEAYYKQMWNVVPYDVDNVRIRYFGENSAQAYATGADFRVAGEFIKGAESWFSLGILQTRENLANDTQDYIRRPTDQMVTGSIFFQDHIPGKPSARVYLNTVFGTGLPFGPPRALNTRSALRGPAYRRVDIGFSYVLTMGKGRKKITKYFDSIWMGLEVLNAFGISNTISYTWIKDVYDTQFAIPNTLSQRFYNARIIINFE